MMDIAQRWRILIITLLVLSNTNSRNGVVESVRVPAMFVFGDSLVDNGNNNWLRSIAKANYYPYGIDFNIGSTGRFSNGKTFVDILGEMVSAPYPSAFTDPATAGARILGGVNYASAAAGILDETGQHYGERYSLSQQVLNFESSLNELRRMMNGTNLTEFLGKSLAVLVFGSNDYINNYLMPSIYSSSYIYSPPQFANLLLNHYARQLYAMYSIGLRKFLIAGVGPLGCIPNQRGTGQSPPDRCVDYVNQMLGSFNEGLKSLVDQLNRSCKGAIFAYGNTYAAVGDILNNPSTYGFTVVDKGCCGIGRNQGEVTCLPFVVPCANRNVYVFWDAFHPTQAVNSILAHRAFSGPPTDCYPINVQQMTLFY
ncbi:zinc finger protein, putative [Ricinus communis]|uniref:Zinc finger protein, putative n=1 Tax=Ricinus communis TaxID=3988 RepID=B9S6J2_RICCO|nr:zinc finger protein, putative [Ricinus communis]|eukprot:XP_002521611.1 GDSL esterase/lipase At1g71250 [Ricinus communis]